MHNRPLKKSGTPTSRRLMAKTRRCPRCRIEEAHPEKSIRTLSYMCSGTFGLNSLSMRNNIVKMAKLKHEQNPASAFAYYFTWQSPMLEDAGAWHTAELQFCFDNTKRCEQGTAIHLRHSVGKEDGSLG